MLSLEGQGVQIGEIDGKPVEAFRLRGGDTQIEVINYGAILTRLTRPDRSGRVADLVLGFDNPARYASARGNAGAICGRHANRLSNGRFHLDGRRIDLPLNAGLHHSHGGPRGFGKRFWTPHPDPAANAVEFRLTSDDGDQGYPGKLHASTTYRLGAEGTLYLTMRASADARTIVNLVHHGYWNLAGHHAGSVERQILHVEADHYTPVRDKIPTGEIAPVAGTPFDFTRPAAIGRSIAQASLAGGYDHNFCIRGPVPQLRRCCVLFDPASGRRLELHSNQPGLQLYTPRQFSGMPVKGKAGAAYGLYAGLALETQNYPDAPNQPGFPSSMLSPGELYEHRMIFHFSIAETA